MGQQPKYTAEDLNRMKITDIKSLAADLGYTLTKSLKAEIIEEFLLLQEV